MHFFELDKDVLEQNLSTILCAAPDSTNVLMTDSEYVPETFTAEDKRNGKRLPFFADVSFESWIQSMVKEQIQAVGLMPEEAETAVQVSIRNLMALMDRCKSQYPIYNQEFVDVIRHITAYTVFGDFTRLIRTSERMNRVADRLVPHTISILKQMGLSEEEWFTLSIISGISGLDMKGAPAAASSYSNDGIPLRPFLTMPVKEAAASYTKSLLAILSSCTKPVFDWKAFRSKVEGGGHLVWLTDDYIESCFDMEIIASLLDTYPELRISMIPKGSEFGNDLSYEQAMRLIPERLRLHETRSRFRVVPNGPQMGAVNIRKLSSVISQMIASADTVIMKGCRIHEMLQGGLKMDSYSAFFVVRTTSEMETGFSSENLPAMLIHLEPGEYSFWGIREDGICCTAKQHRRNQNGTDLNELICERERLSRLIESYSGYLRPLRQELALVEERIQLLMAGQKQSRR